MSNFGPTPLNRTNANITLQDALRILKKEIFLTLNCHAIGTIQSFDTDTQTVTATINYKKTFLKADPVTKVYSPVLVDYPILLDCPIVIMQGGGCKLTFPIAKGDTCIIVFNDRDIDAWLNSGQIGPVNTQRLHSFADAMALIGVRSINNAFSDYDSDNVALGATGSAKLKFYNDTTTLNTLLQDLLSELQNLTSAIAAITVAPGSFSNTGGPVVGISGTPVNASTINSIGSNISDIADDIGGLLA